MTYAAVMGRKLLSFIRLGRPHFLAGGFVMHALGVSAALYAGARLNLSALFWGQVVITATQWMVHYANDYFDLSADFLNATPTRWSGGSRMLVRGALSPKVAYRTAVALGLTAVAGLACLILIAHTGPATTPMALAALFLSWGYSAPPFRWHSRGLGELVTALIVPVLTPVLGFYLQAGYVPSWLLPAVWPLFFLQLCFQFSVNFPDAAGDAAAGKRTFVVRFPSAAMPVYLGCLAAAYLVLPLIWLAGAPLLVAEAVILPAPIAGWLALRAARRERVKPEYWNVTAFGHVVLLLATAAAEILAFAWLSGWRPMAGS